MLHHLIYAKNAINKKHNIVKSIFSIINKIEYLIIFFVIRESSEDISQNLLVITFFFFFFFFIKLNENIKNNILRKNNLLYQ